MAEKLYRATPRGREEIPEDEAAEIRAEWAKNDAERELTEGGQQVEAGNKQLRGESMA